MPPKRKVSDRKLEDEHVAKQAAPHPKKISKSKSKMLAGRQSYPRYEGRDIVISLSPDRGSDLILFKADLVRSSGYFATFEESGWPPRFVLKTRDIQDNLDDCRVIPTKAENDGRKRVETERDGCSQSQASAQASEGHCPTYIQQVNDIIFRLFYRVPVNFSCTTLGKPPAEVLRDVAQLAASYDCIASTRDQIVSAIYTAPEFGYGAIEASPHIFLEVADLVENEKIFVDALQRIAGRRFAQNAEIRGLPPNLAALTNNLAEILHKRVREVCISLSIAPRSDSLSTFVAWAVFHQFFTTHVSSYHESSAELHRSLAYLNGLRTGWELVEQRHLGLIMESVNTMNCALLGARDAIDQVRDEYECRGDDDGRDEYSGTLMDLETAIRKSPSIENVRCKLLNILDDAKKKLKPLFENDQRLGYFTCIDFQGPYPWQEDLKKLDGKQTGE